MGPLAFWFLSESPASSLVSQRSPRMDFILAQVEEKLVFMLGIQFFSRGPDGKNGAYPKPDTVIKPLKHYTLKPSTKNLMRSFSVARKADRKKAKQTLLKERL